jgi:hypothetical protein
MILPCEECLVRASCYNRVHKVANIITKRLFAGYLRSNCSILQKFYWKQIKDNRSDPVGTDKEFFNALIDQFKIRKGEL